MVFLVGDGSAWDVIGWANGVREIDRVADRRALTDRVTEMVEILTIPDGRKRRAETSEWLIRCAGEAATLPDAAELLADVPGWPFPDDPEIGSFAHDLAAERKTRLVDALVGGDAPRKSAAWWKLLRLAGPAPGDRRVLDAVRDVVRNRFGDRLRTASDFMVNEAHRVRVRDVAAQLCALDEEERRWDWTCAL